MGWGLLLYVAASSCHGSQAGPSSLRELSHWPQSGQGRGHVWLSSLYILDLQGLLWPPELSRALLLLKATSVPKHEFFLRFLGENQATFLPKHPVPSLSCILGFSPWCGIHIGIMLSTLCLPELWHSSILLVLSSIHLVNHVWLFATPWTAAQQASLSVTNSWSLLKLISIKLVIPPNHLFLCHPLLLLPSIFPNIRVFSSESVLRIRWPKYWSFSFSISLSNEYSGLIFFRIDWTNLHVVQGTLKNLLQPHSSKASIHLCSAFFMVQLSHPYKTTWKSIA